MSKKKTHFTIVSSAELEELRRDRERLADGTRVLMSWHNYLRPMFFRDRHEQREIEDWYENPLIYDALDWFCERGHRA
ncbi:hypothetical protein [Pseudomonas shirazica]|uniref:hypothetical protein n=1 Tax=Pseudomonas shirazica TaxID=1940636 RepID=UPI001EDCCB8C